MMDSLLLVNGCSCDSIAVAGTATANGSTTVDPRRRLNSKSFGSALSELENHFDMSDEADQQVIGAPSSPLKRPRLAPPNASPLIPSSETNSTEDLWQAFNGFLDDDGIITTCQDEKSTSQQSVSSGLTFSEFVKRYNELSEWLGRIQQSVSTTVGVSRAEVYLHQTVHADLAARQSDRRSLNDYGRALLALRCGPLSDPAMQREIAGYMQSLTHRWQVVERAVTAASGSASGSPPSIDQVFVDLEADLDLLRQWLDNTEESLASCRLPPSCTSRCATNRTESEQKHMQECASLLFDRCKAIQVQIQSQQRFVSAVRRLSDRLASGSQEFLPPLDEFNGASQSTATALFQEKAEAYRLVAEQLENRWQQLWLVSLEVHCRLENILSGQSAPRNEIIRPLSGHDLFAAAYSDNSSPNSSPGSRSASSTRSIGFTTAFGASGRAAAGGLRRHDSDTSSCYRHYNNNNSYYTSTTTAGAAANNCEASSASNSLDILPFSENEYEHIGGSMMESAEICNDNSSMYPPLRRTHSEADCSLDRTPVKKDAALSGECCFGINRNNYSPQRRGHGHSAGTVSGHYHYHNQHQKARRARSETFGSQYQMYFAVSDDSEGHYLDEMAAEACHGRDYSHCNQLALTLPRTASSDSPLPTSADFISTNDTPSSGSGGGADSGRGRRHGHKLGKMDSELASAEGQKQQKRYRRQAAANRRRRSNRYHHAATAGDITADIAMGCMQRSHTYNENLVRHSHGGNDFLGVVNGDNGRASSLDGAEASLNVPNNRRRHQHHQKTSRRDSRHHETSLSSSLYSSDASGTESGCSADGEPGEDCIEETDRLHSTDAVRAAMHRFRWKYCRRGPSRYGNGQRSSSLSSVDAAHKYSISESAIQELHEIYEAYCAKYSSPSINNAGNTSRNKNFSEAWISATASSTTTTMLSPEDQQAIGAGNIGGNSSVHSTPLLKQAPCRSWESENSTLNKTWKRLITLGQDVAAPANFDVANDSPKMCDTTLVDDHDHQIVEQHQQGGLLTLAAAAVCVDGDVESDGGQLSANEQRHDAGDVDWDAYQPPVYTASSDENDEDNLLRTRNLLLSEEGLAVDDDNFLFGENASNGGGIVEEQEWTPTRRRLHLRRRRFNLQPAASLQTVLDYSESSLDEVTLGLSKVRLAIRSSANVDTLAIECRQLLEIADDNLAHLQEVRGRLIQSQQSADLIERVDAIIAVWQRVLADLLGEQRRADDLIRALDELHAINDVIPAIEQRLGYSCSAASSESSSNVNSMTASGIFRFESASGMLEASEESLRVATSISQLHARAESILVVIHQAGNDVLQEQVAHVVASLDRIAEWNEKMRTRCDELHAAMVLSMANIEECEGSLLLIEQQTTTLQVNLTKWASSQLTDDDAVGRLTLAVQHCEKQLSQLIEPSLTDLESRVAETLFPAISDQAVSALRTRLGAIRARMEGERGRLDTLRVAISLASSSLSAVAASPSSPKSSSLSKDSEVQTQTAESSSVDAQTLPEPAPAPSQPATKTGSSWGRRFAKLLFPAQLAIVSIFLILRFFEPFELPIRVTPLLQFHHGPPPV